MRALNAIHAALRPSSVLLNIHPASAHARIAAQVGESLTELGAIDQSVQIQTIQVAQAALRRTIDAHQWQVERAVSFEVLYHFDTVDAWLKYLEERRSGDVVAESLIARARELLAAGDGELIQRRTLHAARLRKT